MQKLIENNIILTVMVLDEKSKKIKDKESLFEITNIRDLVKLIRESLNELCVFKGTLGKNREKLIIKTYDANAKFSYIVVDPQDEYAIMKVEELQGDNPEKRKSYLAYKKDIKKFFQEHWDEIKQIKNVKIYNCRQKANVRLCNSTKNYT